MKWLTGDIVIDTIFIGMFAFAVITGIIALIVALRQKKYF